MTSEDVSPAAEAHPVAQNGGAERSLWILVATVVIVPVVIFVGASSLSYVNHFREAREGLARTLDLVHEHAVKVFETHELAAGHVDEILFGLSDEEIREREPALHGRLKGLADRLPQVSDVWVLDAAGKPLVTASIIPAPSTLDLSDRHYYRVHRDGQLPPGTAYVSERLRGRADSSADFFQFSVRRNAGFERSASFAGVVAISVEPRYFEDFYAQAAKHGLSSLGLARPDGQVLVRYPAVADPAALARSDEFLNAVNAAPEQGLYEAASPFDGEARIYAYRKLPAHPIYALATIDRTSVVARWMRAMADHLMFGLPAALALVFVALLALRQTRREGAALAQLRSETRRREASEDQLRQSQKMEAVGRLTGGIAHDFNNMLAVIVGSLDMLKRRLVDGEARHVKLVDNALLASGRAADLTRRLLAFSRQQALEPKAVDVNRTVGNLSEMLSRTLGETVRIETVLASGLWRSFIDPLQLENAILNLAVNARDAMGPEGGRLTIETANTSIDDAYAAVHAEVKAGQYVMVGVSDTGSGMPPEVAARAFDPFFTTKPQGQGTGLGLSQVYGFIKQSGGHVKIYSELGQGTAVKLYLPRHFGAAAAHDGEVEPQRSQTGDGVVVLVVEDEDSVRAFAAEALRELGYGVLAASGASEALDILAHHREIAVLLTDVVMPDVNGGKLAAEAIRRRPDLKVIFMTGYTRNAIVHNGTLDPGVHLLSKPFSLAELGTKLAMVLNAEPAAAALVARGPGARP
jgi:signal transduction histidine kinase/ActR/RegA family two-component response regulator